MSTEQVGTSCVSLPRQMTLRMEEIPSPHTYPLGLSLSGGSIKGFAHLGVLKYLDEVGPVSYTHLTLPTILRV